MKAFIYQIKLNLILNLRSKELLIYYYVVPLGFYLFMGGVFTSITPESNQTIIQTMSVFSIIMGGVMGSPYPIVEFYHSDIKKAYQVGHIPLWTVVVCNFISALFHLLVMSMIILISAPLIFKAQLPMNLGLYFLDLLLFIIISLLIGTVFGLVCKSSSKMAMATQFVFLPSLMLSGIMFPSSMLPSFLQQLGRIFPATWGYELMCSNELIIKNVTVLLSMGIILFFVTIICLKRIERE